MDKKLYSVYGAYQHSSKILNRFYTVKNLLKLDTENKDEVDIEEVLHNHGIIRSEDLNKHCYMPGRHIALEDHPDIIVLVNFYLFERDTLEIAGDLKICSKISSEDFDFLIFCDRKYADEHGWIDKDGCELQDANKTTAQNSIAPWADMFPPIPGKFLEMLLSCCGKDGDAASIICGATYLKRLLEMGMTIDLDRFCHMLNYCFFSGHDVINIDMFGMHNVNEIVEFIKEKSVLGSVLEG